MYALIVVMVNIVTGSVSINDASEFPTEVGCNSYKPIAAYYAQKPPTEDSQREWNEQDMKEWQHFNEWKLSTVECVKLVPIYPNK